MTNELETPQPIADFIEATNKHNSRDVLAVFADGAFLTDEGQEYRGIAAIKEWSDEKLISAKVTLKVIELFNQAGETIVTAEVDGNFDKTGLPDPFCMDFHFTIDDAKIVALYIRLFGE
jgi:hypothetical protein